MYCNTNTALKQIFSLEKKFKKHKGSQIKYLAFMRDYKDVGHMKTAQYLIGKEEDKEFI